MPKSHFLEEEYLLCLQFIVLLLKDKTKVKFFLMIIRLNASMSWSMIIHTENPNLWQVGGRAVVAPCLLILHNLLHLEANIPTIISIKETGVLNTSTADPKGFTRSLCCLILATVAWASQHFSGINRQGVLPCLCWAPFYCYTPFYCCTVTAVVYQQNRLGFV